MCHMTVWNSGVWSEDGILRSDRNGSLNYWRARDTGETMDRGLVGLLARGQNQGGFVPLKRQGGGTELCRRLGQRDVCTAKTRMEHMGDGIQKQNGIREIGSRRGETRDVRNVFIRTLGTTKRKRGHTVEENTPKREDESPYIKRY